MRSRSAAALLVLFWSIALTAFSFAQQQDEPESNRKVVSRIVPQYPQMARNLNLRGSVRVEALVEPNGTVTSIQVKGGHPVLVEAAQDAVRKWRWEPGARETREPVEFKFDPK
jgi:TonB family protein